MPRHRSTTAMLYSFLEESSPLSDVHYLRPEKLLEVCPCTTNFQICHQYFIPLPTLKGVEDVVQGRRKDHKIRSVKSSTLTVEINMRKKTELCDRETP
jgi:hypothetical protein